MIRVMLVDDDVYASEAMKRNIEVSEDIRVISICNNGKEAVEGYKLLKPDVVIMDINMPVMNGMDACKIIKAYDAQSKIVFLTMFREEAHLVNAFENQCNGYIYKGITRDHLLNVIRNVHGGLTTIPHEAQTYLLNKNDFQEKIEVNSIKAQLNELNEMEIQMIKLIMQGKSNKEIGESLFLSEGHIRNMTMQLRRKLGVKSNIELGVIGAKAGL